MGTKVVYSPCYGGFGMSLAAVKRYCEIKGIAVYPEIKHERLGIITYWTAPESDRTGILVGDEFYGASVDERVASNARYRELQIDPCKIPRHDATLVQVVEEMGKAASGEFACLRIAEIDGSLYRIDEYDGNESVETPGDVEWTVAA